MMTEVVVGVVDRETAWVWKEKVVVGGKVNKSARLGFLYSRGWPTLSEASPPHQSGVTFVPSVLGTDEE